MLNNQVPKSKPQGMATTRPQGTETNDSSNNTTFKDSKSRYEKGMSLYKEGKVKLGSNGLFKVSGYYEVDTERMSCNCPDWKTRKEPCKHLFAAMLFVKNRGKEKIAGLNGSTKPEPKDTANKPAEAQKQVDNKPFDRQATITRLAVINSAIELLKTHRKPIGAAEVVSIAAQLEKWALGN